MPKRVSTPKEETPAQSVKENKMVPVVSLYPHAQNYKQHPPEQIRKIKASLERFGQVRSIVIQECENGSYTIVAGHGVVEAATQLKMPELRADVFASWVPETEIRGYLVADNLLGVDAVDDERILVELLQEQHDAGFDLASLGSDEETLRQMLESLGDAYLGDGERDESEDELPEEVETRAKLGDIWQLGRHTVACLDSCDPETYTKLFEGVKPAMVFADPPYGVKERTMRKTAGRGKLAECNDFSSVIGDDKPFEPAMFLRLPIEIKILWGANYFADKLPTTSSWIVWDKRDGIPSNDNADCELAWTTAGGPARLFTHRWNGMIKASEQGEKRVHPTQKPIALAEWCYEKYGKEHDIIYDPFLGSGMSLIAAENTNRTVIGCELSPEYIDIIIARWEKISGQTATLLERIEEEIHA